MKVALVHEWLTTIAGSEKVLEAAAELYPDAPVHALVCDPDAICNSTLSQHCIRTSFLQHLPLSRRYHRLFLPLMPLAVEQFDLREFDVVISSNHVVAKGSLTRADQLHIAYIHTPLRYGWDLYFDYMAEAKLGWGPRGLIWRLAAHYLRQWDVITANRVDAFIANSRYIARRIRKIYRRDAQVVYPPVDIDRFAGPDQDREDFYLVVSRLVPYKRVDVIIEAFNRLKLPLVVVGTGPDFARCRRLARPDAKIEFSGYENDAKIASYMQRCRAFLIAADEDFGITPVEAQAAGAAVIAFGRGGSQETVLPGRTGCFFSHQTPESIADAVREFERDPRRFDPAAIRAHARQFSRDRFKANFSDCVDRLYNDFKQNRL